MRDEVTRSRRGRPRRIYSAPECLTQRMGETAALACGKIAGVFSCRTGGRRINAS